MRDQVEGRTGNLVPVSGGPIPAFAGGPVSGDMRDQMTKAIVAWLLRTPSPHTRKACRQDLDQFLAHAGIAADAWEQLAQGGMSNSTIRRKLTALRSLFSYLKTYGYTGANPAHGDFVAAPAVSRDGKTLSLSGRRCGLIGRSHSTWEADWSGSIARRHHHPTIYRDT